MKDLLERLRKQVIEEMENEAAQSMSADERRQYADDYINAMTHVELLTMIGYL